MTFIPKHDPKKQVIGMQNPMAKTYSKEELDWLEGKTVETDSDNSDETDVLTKITNEVQSSPANTDDMPRSLAISPVVTQPAVQVVSQPVAQDNTIVINDANKKVEVRFETQIPKGDSMKTITFSVAVNNVSVDATEDGVSIFMKNDITIKPPTLIPLTLIVNDSIKYDVIYTGGRHRLNNFINMVFVRISDE